MLIHDDFVFVHVPKVAGTSIKAWLSAAFPGCKLSHPSHRPCEVGRPMVVGGVRSPWSWYRSLWMHMQRKGHSYGGVYHDDLSTFVKRLASRRQRVRSATWLGQLPFDGRGVMEMLLRYLGSDRWTHTYQHETICQDLRRIFGVEPTLPLRGVSPQTLDRIDGEAYEMIAESEAWLIEMFGYGQV